MPFSESAPEYHFFHGWLYDSGCFEPLIAELQPETMPIFHDRGYFTKLLTDETESSQKILTRTAPRIAVTHSAGLLFLQENFNFSDFDCIFCFSGFLHFSQTPHYTEGVPVQEITALRRALENHPERAFSHFRRNCGETETYTPPYFNTEKLLTDLTAIERAQAPAPSAMPSHRLYAAHGAKDQIFSFQAFLQNRLFFHAQEAICFRNADHLFIMKQPDLCARYIRTRFLARKMKSSNNA